MPLFSSTSADILGNNQDQEEKQRSKCQTRATEPELKAFLIAKTILRISIFQSYQLISLGNNTHQQGEQRQL
jgi:hypothetical protein